MAYEQRDNSGSMFRNMKKENEKHADMQGSALINGEPYWVNAWRKVDKNGNPWYSFSFRKKEAQQAARSPAPATVNDDEIPF